jgi:pimeloyl-ACP methyl ester carboxylesterase
VPELKRGDGVEIHWEERGEGPVVFFAHAGWMSMPSTHSSLLTDLATDHRVVTRDPRGVGQSTRRGPYDIGTDADDMAALVDEVGRPAVVVSAGANGSCLRVAAERPQLIEAVVLASSIVELQLQGEIDSLVGSESVIEAGLKQLRTDPRPVLRTLISISNPQLSDAEARERVAAQVAYCPLDTARERAEASMSSDDLTQTGPALGDRLWVIYSENPLSPRELLKSARDLLPDAHIVEAEDGPISRPDITAGVVRKITAPLRACRKIGVNRAQLFEP